MGEIIEKRRRHYSGLDADKNTIPAGGKAVGDSFFATDKLKLYYWQGGSWKTGLGYEYVPRAVAAIDFTQVNFTLDGALHENGLDLSGIVPEGATAVHLAGYIKDNAANSIFSLRSNQTTKLYNMVQWTTQVANIYTNFVHPIINIDADRLLDYTGTAGMTEVLLFVLGWYI